MITKVKIKNWRSHLDSELNFSSGTNVLLGSMGSGKTSVLDSICFAFFGTTPTLQTKKLKLDDIIMKKPIEKNRAEVEVYFHLNGATYSVKRIIEKGKGTTYSEIRENGKLLEAPNSQRVTELVEKILKVDYELFSKAIYSEQNALDYFLTIPKGQRMKKIDELLAIDKFEKARAGSVTLTNKIAERKLGIQSIVDQVDIENLERNVSELKISLDKILKEKAEIQKSFEDITNKRLSLEEEVSELKKIKENLDLLKREERGISSVIEEISNSIRSVQEKLKKESKESIQKKLDEIKTSIEEFEKKLKSKKIEYEKISSFLSESKTKLEILKKEKIEKLEKEFKEKLRVKEEFEHLKSLIGENISQQLDEKKRLFEKLVGELEALRVKIKDLEEVISQLSQIEGKCPVCDSKLTDERRNLLIKQKQQQVKALIESLESVNKKKQLNEKELKQLEEAAKKLDEMILEIKDLEEVKEELENYKKLFVELSEIAIKTENQFSQIKKEIEIFENNLKEGLERKQNLEFLLLQIKDYEEKRSRLGELIKQSEILKVKIEDTEKKLIGKNLVELENELKQLIAKEKEYETKILGLEQLIKEREERIEEFEEKLTSLEKQKEEIKKLDKLIQELRIFEKALEQTQIELRNEFVEAVNYTMNKLWSTLYPYQDFVGIGLSIQEGDYVLQLKTRAGEWVNVEGIASGGERSIACLALRIAFALVMAPNLRLLVLDEPTANLDSSAITLLATTLRERIQEFIDQCFLITHQVELEDGVSGMAYRLERNKEKEEPTKVISL